jgi:hypothetical protein
MRVGYLNRAMVVVGALALSCASTPNAPPTSKRVSPAAGVQRIPDSAPERSAALRAAAPAELELEPSDDRWGIEAAKERERIKEQEATTPVKAPAPKPTGSIGVPPAPNVPTPPKPPTR